MLWSGCVLRPGRDPQGDRGDAHRGPPRGPVPRDQLRVGQRDVYGGRGGVPGAREAHARRPDPGCGRGRQGRGRGGHAAGRGRLFRKADRLRDQAIPRRAGWNGARRGSRDVRLRRGRRGADRALENQTRGLLLPGLAVGRSGRHTSAATSVSLCTGRGPEGFTLTASSVPPPGLLDAHPTGLVAAPATSVSPCRLATPSAFRSATRAASRRWCSRRPTPARSGRTPPRGSTPPGSRRGPAAPARAAAPLAPAPKPRGEKPENAETAT